MTASRVPFKSRLRDYWLESQAGDKLESQFMKKKSKTEKIAFAV